MEVFFVIPSASPQGDKNQDNKFSQVLSGIGDAILRNLPIAWLLGVLVQ